MSHLMCWDDGMRRPQLSGELPGNTAPALGPARIGLCAAREGGGVVNPGRRPAAARHGKRGVTGPKAWITLGTGEKSVALTPHALRGAHAGACDVEEPNHGVAPCDSCSRRRWPLRCLPSV